MSFDSKKTILLEKKYLYVRASLGFQLEGVSTEKIPTNNGFYRFYVDNLSKALGNSYVNILYDSQDLTLQCFCSDLYMDELMSSDSSAIEDVVEELKNNTSTILEFETGVSSALDSNHQDNVALHTSLESFSSNVSPKLKYLPNYFDCLLRSIGIYNNSLCYDRIDNWNSVISVPLTFSDFKKYTYINYNNVQSVWFESFKNFSIPLGGNADFSFFFNVPSYFSEISSIFDSYTCNFYGYWYSNTNFTPVSVRLSSEPFVSLNNFLTYYRPSGSPGGNNYAYSNMRFRISDNLYKFLCLCSNEKNNFFFKEFSSSSSLDFIYITRGDNMPCCSLNQKLNIYKNFDSEQNYEFTVTFDFPFDEATFKKFHFYFLVNNSFIEVVPSFVNKGLHDLLNCNFSFSGNSSYYIESMSVFPF